MSIYSLMESYMKKTCRLSFNKEARRDRKQIPTDN